MELRLPLKKQYSIVYHSLFDYYIQGKELDRWVAGKKVNFKIKNTKKLSQLKKYSKRKLEKQKLISEKKLKIANNTLRILKLIPSIKMVAITGSLAMMNASEESDIDLMVITTSGALWTTRLITTFLLLATGIKLRRSGDKNEKDKLCLNMWIDENYLEINKRNIFTAHEIAQIVPLINKDEMYEKFLFKNKWVLDYWPKAVKVKKVNLINKQRNFRIGIIEEVAFKIQYLYMKGKITNETISKTRAFFHPHDWNLVINSMIKSA